MDHYLYAVDADDGSNEWSYETGGMVESSPAIVDGTVFIGSHDNHLYALDATIGSKQWDFDTDLWVKSSPVIVNGFVFVVIIDRTNKTNCIYAVDSNSGTKHWSYESKGQMESSLAISDETLYFGTNDQICAINSKNNEDDSSIGDTGETAVYHSNDERSDELTKIFDPDDP